MVAASLRSAVLVALVLGVEGIAHKHHSMGVTVQSRAGDEARHGEEAEAFPTFFHLDKLKWPFGLGEKQGAATSAELDTSAATPSAESGHSKASHSHHVHAKKEEPATGPSPPWSHHSNDGKVHASLAASARSHDGSAHSSQAAQQRDEWPFGDHKGSAAAPAVADPAAPETDAPCGTPENITKLLNSTGGSNASNASDVANILNASDASHAALASSSKSRHKAAERREARQRHAHHHVSDATHHKAVEEDVALTEEPEEPLARKSLQATGHAHPVEDAQDELELQPERGPESNEPLAHLSEVAGSLVAGVEARARSNEKLAQLSTAAGSFVAGVPGRLAEFRDSVAGASWPWQRPQAADRGDAIRTKDQKDEVIVSAHKNHKSHRRSGGHGSDTSSAASAAAVETKSHNSHAKFHDDDHSQAASERGDSRMTQPARSSPHGSSVEQLAQELLVDTSDLSAKHRSFEKHASSKHDASKHGSRVSSHHLHSKHGQ